MNTTPLLISPKEAMYKNGEVVYFHNGEKSKSGAYEIFEKCEIQIKIPRSFGTTKLILNFYNENKSIYIISVPALWSGINSNYDIYTADVELEKLGVGLYFYNVEIQSAIGKIYGTKVKTEISFGFSSNFPPSFQFSVTNFKFIDTNDLKGGIIYHIFVDRFAKSEQNNTYYNDSDVYIDDWYAPIPEIPAYPGAPIKNNYFYGGSLFGICEKLEYIKSLGVNIIYLSPIFESPSNHKYDTADYMKVDDNFGGEDALCKLIQMASKLGISIILDGVFNHTGADSLYFNKFNSYDSTGAFQSTESKYYDWYEFQNHPNKYTSWWGIEILPRINPDIPSCRNYLSGEGGVIEKYAKLGVKGFRLDVVDELSDDFIKSIKKRLSLTNPSSVLYGEVWEDASNKISYGVRKKYFLGCELDGVMNYPLRTGLISFLRYGTVDNLLYALTDIINNAPKRIRDMQMNLVGSHDTERIITALGGETPIGKSNKYLSIKKMSEEEYGKAKKLLMSAFTVLLTLPGIPSLYYGDEAGLEGYGDPFNRLPFPWKREDKELTEHFRKISDIRLKNSVYKNGEYNLIFLDKSVLIFSRVDSESSYLTIVNNSDSDINFIFKNEAISLFTMKSSFSFVIKSKSSDIIKSNIINQLEF